jgi:Tol biopolymer transport system component/imidazolonepropionase-like amidohydrolase
MTLIPRRKALGFVLFLTCVLAASLHAADAPKDDKKDDKPKWDVSNPPGTWTAVDIDTAETTWSNLDVSPDGKSFVFDMLGDLYVVPIEGGEGKALTEGIAWDTEPRYSPDGKRIAFISDRGGADNVWVVDAGGSNPRAVTEEKEHLVHNPSWSPDGDYIVAKKDFTSTRSIAAGEIWLFSVGGGEGLALVERPDGARAQKNIAEPSFSPDGRYVYFSQDTTPGRIWEYNKNPTGEIFTIRRLDRRTGEVDAFVAGAGGAIRPTPSRDGRFLAFVRRTPAMTSALYVKDLATGVERPVYDRLERDLQETDGSQGNTAAFGWTPDSASIVFWTGGKFHRVDVASKAVRDIPVHVRTSRKVRTALRFPVEVSPDEFDVRMPRWVQVSPDGSQVVFQALGRLYVKDLAGGRQRLLTGPGEGAPGGGWEFHPSFSRDGRFIVYTTWSDEHLGSVRVVPARGGASRTITKEPGHYVEPRFSPDGKRVVFRKVTGGYLTAGAGSQEPGIYLIGAEGGTPRILSRTGEAPHFAAAPDRVYFSDTLEETKLVLKSVNLEGVDAKTHFKGEKITSYSVSPDGRWVAFTEKQNAFVAPLATTGKTVDLSAESKSLPVRQVSSRSGENLHWSSDASKLRWAHGATLYARELKDAYAFLAGAPATLPEPVASGTDLSFRAAADKPAGRTALVGARVVTMRDAGRVQEVIENGVVLVNGKRIEAVGPRGQVAVPKDARMIDLTGKTIVPGLVDVHAHGPFANEGLVPEQNWQQLANLAFGVTTIHDPSNDTASVFAAAELQKAGLIVAPRIFSTGTILYGAHAPSYTAAINSYDDALFHVRRLKEAGAISVKSYQQPRRDQRQQVIAAGAELGVMVVPEGGAKFQFNMSEIVDGHTGIEHALPIADVYDDVKQLWSRTGTGYTPTFVVAYGGLAGETYWYDRTDVWKSYRLMRFTPHFDVDRDAIRRLHAPDDQYNHFQVAKTAHELRNRGVSVQIGAHGQRAGLAAHWEIWMMVQGGFTPWEALRGATIDGARYVGLDRDIGSLEPGKLADLFVIEGNPLEDIRVSERVSHCMLGGRLYDATTMDEIAPDKIKRRPFFFDKEGGDTIHPATQAWLEDLRTRYGWRH